MSAPSPPPASTRESSKIAACGCADGSKSAAGRGSRRPIPSRSRSPNGTERKIAVVDIAVRQTAVSHRQVSPPGLARGSILFRKNFLRRGWIASELGLARVPQYSAPQIGQARLAVSRPAMTARRLALVALLGLGLAGCSSSLLSIGAPPGALPGAPKLAQQQQAPIPSSREHQRILAAYNGAYDDAQLEGVLNQMVAKLVAASERPDVHYRVTILNSAAVNAFALPSGQLYVTRGLIALASDTSELASVVAHEMSHVIASHATMREEEARQVALVTRVFTDLGSDPETSALALAKSKIKLASFSRAQELEADGIGVGMAARAGYDPYGAVRFLTSMGRNSELKAPPGQTRIDPRAPDFLSSHPATPERIKNAQANARQFSAPGAGERDKAGYLAGV